MKNLTEGNISKNFIMFAIPMIISGLMSRAFSVINTMVVGKVLGEQGLAAVGSTASFITIISSLMWGLGTGIATYIGSIMGSGDYRKMVNEIKANMCIVVVGAVALSGLVILLHKPIFAMLAINKDIYADAFAYYGIYLSGFVFMSINACSVYILSAMGNTSYPMVMSMISCVVNIVGNILLIAVFGMGVAGAAVASVLAASINSSCYLIKLHFEFKKLGIVKQKVVFDKAEIVKAWKQGIPAMIQQMVMYVSSVCIQPSINILGSSAIAGYAICLQVYDMTTAIFYNSSKSIATFCAQCVGGKRIQLVNKGLKICIRQSVLLTIPIMLVLFLFPRQITSLFFNDVNTESAGYVITYIYMCVPFVVCQIINNMFHNFYRGVLMPKVALFTTFVYSVVRVISTYALVPFFEMNGVFFGFIIAWVTEMLLCIYVYFSNRWKSEWYINLEMESKKPE